VIVMTMSASSVAPEPAVVHSQALYLYLHEHRRHELHNDNDKELRRNAFDLEATIGSEDDKVVGLYGKGSTDVEFLRHNNGHVALKVGDILFDNWRLNEHRDFLLFFNHQVNARLTVPLYEEEGVGVVAASLETRATDNVICRHAVSRSLLDRILDADDWQPGRLVLLKGDQADEK
jgi:hypothetical protein